MSTSPRNLNVFYFLIYAMLGWVFEFVYCFIVDGELVNRGFLYGPYLPVYGFGAIIIINIIAPYVKTAIGLFIASFILCTGLEYFTSWYMEITFHVQLWDYSNYFLNVNGRVCLWNSSLFGVLSLAVIYVFQPLFTHFLNYIPEKLRPIISLLIVIGLLTDLFFVGMPYITNAANHTGVIVLFT